MSLYLLFTCVLGLQYILFLHICPIFQPQNFHPVRFFKFVSMTTFWTICYFLKPAHILMVEQKRNLMAHAQKLDLVFHRNGRVHLYRRGCQFSRLLAAEVCGSAVEMLDRPCPIQCMTVLATPSIRLFPLHFSTRAFPCAIRFRFCSTWNARKCFHDFLKNT